MEWLSSDKIRTNKHSSCKPYDVISSSTYERYASNTISRTVDDGMERKMHNPLQNQGFKFHLLAYIIVNIILIVVNLMNPTHIWFFWPLLGWGIGLAAHGYAVSKAPSGPTRPIPRMPRQEPPRSTH